MAFASNVFVQKCLVCTADLSHVTNLLYKQGIFVQIRWTHCNKTNNFQCCQYHTLIRILPEEPKEIGASNLRFTGDPKSTLELVVSQTVPLDTISGISRVEAAPFPQHRSTLRDQAGSGSQPDRGPVKGLQIIDDRAGELRTCGIESVVEIG